jgi:uncharacterized membrane protein YphA (DoxX/SURF4 family)
VLLELATRLRGYRRLGDGKIVWAIGVAWGLMAVLLVAGLALKRETPPKAPAVPQEEQEGIEEAPAPKKQAEDGAEGNRDAAGGTENEERVPAFLKPLLSPWNQSHAFVLAALGLFIAATACLLLGLWTRTSAVIAWVLSMSFANLNPWIDNAGDSVRGIILFYLMVCPCGAAWSIDSWWARRSSSSLTNNDPGAAGPARQAEPTYVYPWALRLLFIQMMFIYFCNGLYKVFSKDWYQGEMLYYVMRDLVLTRFSYSQFPMPLWMTKIMTWTVLAWELGFPLWVAVRWTRTPALLMGVAFHVGIFLTMELGGFVPYMLVLYLPLLPWLPNGKCKMPNAERIPNAGMPNAE